MVDTETIIKADSLTPAVEVFLTKVVVAIQGTVPEQSGYLIGYDVEADDVPTMIMRALAEIRDVAAEQHGAVIACEVAGIQRTDHGHRLWGTIEIVRDANGIVQSTRVDEVTFEPVGSSAWTFRIKRPS